MDDASFPSTWVNCTIEEICQLNPKSKLDDNLNVGFMPMAGVPTSYFGSTNYEQRPWHSVKKGFTQFKNGDAIFAKITPCFENSKAAVIRDFPNGWGAGSTEYYVLRPYGKLVLSELLFALTKTKEFLTEGAVNMSGSVGHKRVPKDFVLKYNFPLPPLAEQKIIADKLDTLLAQVESTKARLERITQILKRFRQSVLAAAVSGGLTEDWRDAHPEKSADKLLEGHEALPRPPRWKSRSLSFIQGNHATAVGKPETSRVANWKWVSLVDIARMESGHTPSRNNAEYWGGNVCWIGIRDANRAHATTIEDTEQKTNELGLANSASRLLPEGTVCVSRTASVGYVVKMGKPMATSQDFVNWVPSSVLDSDWLKWLFVAETGSLYKFGKGSTHTTIYFPEWLSMHVLLPHIEEQREIARRIEYLLSQADNIEKQVAAAQKRVDSLTQSILAKAFRGELTEQWRKDNPDLISAENSAEALLERIKAEREAVKPVKNGRRRKAGA